MPSTPDHTTAADLAVVAQLAADHELAHLLLAAQILIAAATPETTPGGPWHPYSANVTPGRVCVQGRGLVGPAERVGEGSDPVAWSAVRYMVGDVDIEIIGAKRASESLVSL